MSDRFWSTAAVAPSLQAEMWGEVTRRYFAPLEMRPERRPSFAAEGRIGLRGRIRLSRVVTEAHTAHQTRRSIGAGPGEGFSLKYVAGRRLIAEQWGERVELGPGEIALIDLSAPCSLEFPEGADLYALYLPADLLAPRLGPRRRPPSLRLPRGGLSTLIGSLLQALWPLGAEDLGALDGGLLDYLASLIGQAARGQTKEERGRVSLARILYEIEAGLGDPALSAAAVARRLGISRSHLYAVLAQAGTSFAAELRRRRLDAAARLLEGAPARSGLVGDVAMRCGYSDAASFTRAFRRRFGHPPSLLSGRKT
jgi:AraC-like DNA-binding protein